MLLILLQQLDEGGRGGAKSKKKGVTSFGASASDQTWSVLNRMQNCNLSEYSSNQCRASKIQSRSTTSPLAKQYYKYKSWTSRDNTVGTLQRHWLRQHSGDTTALCVTSTTNTSPKQTDTRQHSGDRSWSPPPQLSSKLYPHNILLSIEQWKFCSFGDWDGHIPDSWSNLPISVRWMLKC